MIHPLDRLDDDFTDGTVTMSGRELPEHLWKHLTDDQEDRFAQHVNDSYTPWDVLDHCTPFGDLLGMRQVRPLRGLDLRYGRVP